MIYLRTGSNGACKSLFTLYDVREMQVKENRPVCIVRGRLKVYESTMVEFGWRWIDFDEWEAQQDGTIFLCDEVHKDLPNGRPPTAPVPKHIQNLAEHRARGFDFFMLTQHPLNIDVFVRRLIGAPGYHQHLKRLAGGSSITNVLQWDAVRGDCEKDGSGKSGQVTTRTQPKEVFKWYDSTSLNTAKTKIPFQVKALVVFMVAIPLLGWFGYRAIGAKTAVPATPGVVAMVSQGVAGKTPEKGHVMTVAEYADSHKPRIEGLAYTAPRYDEATKPVNVPYPAACLSMAGRCDCYSQQATKLPVPMALCQQIVKGGFFNDWQQALRDVGTSAAVKAVEAVPVSLALPIKRDALGNPDS
jgi:zona occludens toxin